MALAKHTTLRAISGLAKSTGQILYEGKNIANEKPHKIVAAGLSHVPEGRMVFANLTVAENLDMGAYLQRDKAVNPQGFGFRFSLFPRLAERRLQNGGNSFRGRATNAGHWPRAHESSGF